MFRSEVKQRDIREALRNGAVDLRDVYKRLSYSDFLKFCDENEMHCVAQSYGVYGINGVVCRDKHGTLYACPTRSAVALFVMDM